jgi:hypothetical protein
MTSPIELITVPCRCGHIYETPYRASFNLNLDDFDEAYMEKMSTGRCPACGHVTELGALVVERDRLSF